MSLGALVARGRWTNPPLEADYASGTLRVTAVEGSDAWRETSYSFIHDSEHALVAPVDLDRALEVSFLADFSEQFDQAGLFLRVSDSEWVKAGLEFADGEMQVGAVVTHGTSDWSVAPVPDWRDRSVTIRASRSGNAVTVRARVEREPWRLIRVAYLDASWSVEGGIFCASPTRAGFTATFSSYAVLDADASLH